MNAVGIDVSKGKSMVTILRPFGEIVSSPREIRHTSDQIDNLCKELDGLIHELTEYRDAIAEGNADRLKTLLREGRERKEEIDFK